MHTVILLAGYGSRLNKPDLAHKSLLPFGSETLLSRHLDILQSLQIEKIHLVVGHNRDKVQEYVSGKNHGIPIDFVENERYLETGNTLSMVLGLEKCPGDVLVLDGDVLYPGNSLREFVLQSPDTSFALTDEDMDNEEATKVLIRPNDTIHAFVTKRALTEDEKEKFRYGGEAIGFFKLSGSDVQHFLELYRGREEEFEKTLWEIPLTDFAQLTRIYPWKVRDKGCIEIDTPEDYRQALGWYRDHPDWYC